MKNKPSCAGIVLACRHCVFLFFFLSFFINRAAAQSVSSANFNMIGTDDGLSQNIVYDVKQGREGFMWMATMDGLNRYDGYHFVVFRHNDKDAFSLSSSRIQKILEDAHGRMWIGTFDDGVNYFDRIHQRFYHFLPGADIASLLEDKEGNLWTNSDLYITRIRIRSNTGSDKQTLPFRFDTSRLLNPDFQQTENFKSFRIVSDSHKNIFLLTHAALYQLGYDETKHQFLTDKRYRFNINKELPQFVEDRNTGKYYLLLDDGVWESANAQFSHPVLIHNNVSKNGVQVFIDNKSRMWYAKWGKTYVLNLQTKKDEVFSLGKYSDMPLLDVLSVVCQDTNGTLWMNTFNYGLVIWNEDINRFHTALPGQFANSFTELQKGMIDMWGRWKIYLQGKRAKVVSVYRNPDSPDYYRGRMLTDRNGDFWYGADTNLFRYSAAAGSVRVPNPPAELLAEAARQKSFFFTASGNVRQPETYLPAYRLADKDNFLWMYYESGFLLYDVNKHRYSFLASSHPYQSNSNSERAMYEDADGQIWAVMDNGVYCYNKTIQTGRFFAHNKDVETSLAGAEATCFCDDPLQPHTYIWIGTREGLSRMDKQSGVCRNFTTKEGLPNNVICGLLNDGLENIWMSTNRGLCRLHAADAGLLSFDVSDGLPNNEYNRDASLRMQDGTLVFGGMKGITYFNPEEISPLPPPDCLITGCKVFGKSIIQNTGSVTTETFPYRKEVNLSYRDNIVTFEFAGIDYRKKNALQYRYKLTGFDNNWNYCGSSNTATYTNLDPGDYTLVAEASNTNGIWGKKSAVLQVHILPLWWQTWWAKLLALGVVVCLVNLFYRYRLQKALEVERVRNGIARDLHDEIGSTLSAIAIFSKMAHEQILSHNANPEPLLKRISESSQKVMEKVSDIVWSVSTKNDSFETIINHMQQHASQLLELKGYELHFTVDEKLNNVNLGMEKRQNIYLIFKEALNNIIKHANGKNVWIVLRKEKNQLVLFIKDDGVGFDNNHPKNGNGLQNMKSRAASIRGDLHIYSNQNSGSEIEVRVPV